MSANIERLNEKLNSKEIDAPKVLIETLKQINEQLAYGLIILIRTGNAQESAILRDSSYIADGVSSYGVHPDRGLIQIGPKMAEPIRNFYLRAFEEQSIVSPLPVILDKTFEDLNHQSGGHSVVNLEGPQDSSGFHSYYDYARNWQECFNRSFEIAQSHMDLSDERLKQIKRMIAV